MSSQAFLWINAGLGAAILLLFAIRRGQRQPTRLRLRATSSNEMHQSRSGPAARKRVLTLDPETMRAQALHPREKNLNILFNYNGHAWDAFEVLGLPAGATTAMVEEAYRKELQRASESGRDFIDTAYQAVRQQRRA